MREQRWGMKAKVPALLLALAALLGSPARAALFEDEDARRAIIELRAKLQQLEDAQKQRFDSSAAQADEQIAKLRNSLLDLNAQLEAMRNELAKLRGGNEQVVRDLSDTQRKLSDQVQALDARLKSLEPQKVSLDGREFQVSPEERRQYDAAMALVRQGDFAEAGNSLLGFQKRFPGSGYSDSVRFWLGNAQYGRREYKDAIATFKAFISGNPEHPRAAEALLALANCQLELKDVKTAKRSLEDLIKAYPGTNAAQAGKERLASLK
jgi:tol-pal system protein YbgF